MPSTNIITSNCFSQIADVEYEGGKPPSRGIISLQAPHLKEFFDNIGSGPYTLIMDHQDFGIYYQSQMPPHKNIINMAQSDKFAQTLSKHSREIYTEPIILWENVEGLNPDDRYIISTYNFPLMTFDTIPPQIIKWFAVNSCVEEIESLPLGVADPDELLATLDKKILKQNKLLVCHANHTIERFMSKLYFIGLSQGIEWVDVVEENLSKHEFYELIASYEFVLCPAGNGIDTYRLWEALYLGSTPVIDHDFQPYLQELGVIRFKRLQDITIAGLIHVKVPKIRGGLLSYGYWEDKIRNAR